MTLAGVDDHAVMQAAIALAARSRGRASPNPDVACKIVKDGRIVGRGVTGAGGRPHAEAQAIAQAGGLAQGATAYVTLEPCFHQSARGPRCVDLLIAAGLKRVVVACEDPDPRTAGQGIAALREAGLSVDVGCHAAEASVTMDGFFMRQRAGRPIVSLKLAVSLDGRIAMADGKSQWITSATARAHGHSERAQHDAILVGGGTLRADQPRLDVRLAGLADRSPNRVVLTRGDAEPGWTALSDPKQISDLPAVNRLLVEGGAQTASAFLAADLVDRLIIYRAPIIVGDGLSAVGDIGLTDLGNAHGRWMLEDQRLLGPDLMTQYRRQR